MSTTTWTDEAAARASPAAALCVEFLERPTALEAWEAYERATRSYTCTRAFVEYFEEGAAATLALVRPRPGGEPWAAFLYHLRADGSAQVLGRYAAPPAPTIAAFADAVFERHPTVQRIVTDLIEALPDATDVGRPTLALRDVTEMRIALPGSVEEFEGALESKVRSALRYHRRRLAREHPSVRLDTREREEIPRSWIAEVVRLNRERMASKHTESVFSPHYEEGIFRVARAHGYATVLHDGSRIWAGTIDVRCGPEVFGWVIGHDNAFGTYSPGMQCQLAAVEHSIARGARTFHLMQGESRYKRELGGSTARLAAYVVLRSWASLRLLDVSRLCEKRVVRLARRSLEGGDRIAERLLHRKAALSSLARAVAHRSGRLGRR
jgi:CelD/BcsL family acetyltransferase involved in cellulose biosynthesis